MTPLRQQMLNAMTVRNLAPRTQQQYLHAVAQLAHYYHRSPDTLSDDQIQAYLLYLVRERQLAWSTINIVVQGLRFFYRVTLRRTHAEFVIPRPKVPSRLPELLSVEDVAQRLQASRNLKHRAFLMTTYAAGLRLSEVTTLSISAVNSQRMQLRIVQGKGAQDRYVPLSPRLLTELRGYWRIYRPASWLFPDRHGQKPLSPRTGQQMFYLAKQRANITKRCGIHGLRHAYATHLLEAGVDVLTLKRFLGHHALQSTLRYLHMARTDLTPTASPLDLLNFTTQSDD